MHFCRVPMKPVCQKCTTEQGSGGGEQMIRQTINCDICAAEKQATSYWFVAYEQGGEITLRGWEAPRSSRKHAKHLCGQKCVQRMMSNFTAAVMANGHGEVGREMVAEAAEPVSHAAQVLKPKENLWDMPHRLKMERESFLHAARPKPAGAGRLQKMA
jgi:hypothetical protein